MSSGQVLCTVGAMGMLINEILEDVMGFTIDSYE